MIPVIAQCGISTVSLCHRTVKRYFARLRLARHGHPASCAPRKHSSRLNGKDAYCAALRAAPCAPRKFFLCVSGGSAHYAALRAAPCAPRKFFLCVSGGSAYYAALRAAPCASRKKRGSAEADPLRFMLATPFGRGSKGSPLETGSRSPGGFRSGPGGLDSGVRARRRDRAPAARGRLRRS